MIAGLMLALYACDDTAVERDADGVDADVRMDADMDADVDEELVCDGGCWVQRCRELSYADGPSDGPLEVGEMRDGAFVPYADGGQATLVYGFQGGVMIEPVVRVPADVVGAEDCVQITVRNLPDPDYPSLAGELSDFPEAQFIDPLRPDDTGHFTATVFDQLGWVTEPELRLRLEVEARGVDWVRSTELALHVVDADGLDACDVVPRQGVRGCEIGLLMGSVTVDAVGSLEGVACEGEVDVSLTLTPEIDVPSECVELTRTVSITRGCIEEQGLTVGHRIDSTRWDLPLTEDGACPPEHLGLLTGGCACP